MFEMTPSVVCGDKTVKLDTPKIMAIINMTPDSFSDGGQFDSCAHAVAHALRMVDAGADLLDIGGESTRPNAAPVSVEEELARVMPVIEALAGHVSVPIAIDTSKPEVMRAAVAAGAGLINDVFALRREGALETAAALNVPVCLMHMLGAPANMQEAVHYDDVLQHVRQFLVERIFACEMSGISKKNILIDPGFGFGKHLEHNLKLLANLSDLKSLDLPILVGLSRKSMIGQMTGRDLSARDTGSAAAALLAAQQGASIIRVHDVVSTRDALAVLAAVSAQKTQTSQNTRKPSIQWPDED